MMLGSGDPTPYDMPALMVLCLLAALMLVGCVLGQEWQSLLATVVRWGAVILAVFIVAGVLIITPTISGIVGAGRLLTLWPAALSIVAFFLIWSWRIGHF
jgi:hypothetical protein